MAIDTYGELKSAVADYLQRADLTSYIPGFIEFANARLNDELRIDAMLQVADTTLDGQYNALPTGFIAMRSLESADGPLVYMTPEALSEFAQTGAIPVPARYSIVAQKIRVYPVPSSLAVTMSYYKAFANFVNDADTNWLLEQRPDLYLFGALVNAASFLMDDPRIPLWEQRFQQALESVRRQQATSAAGAASLVIRVK